MIPGAFEYHRPSELSEAIQLISKLGDDAVLVAGGHSLIPMMKLRLAVPDHLIDLCHIGSLHGIEVEDGEIRIGATTTQAEIIASRDLAQQCPILREAALQIADPQVRNLGTIGGNAANGDPGNDMPAVFQALDASYHLEGAAGSRSVKAREYYEAAYETARDDAEILTAISFRAPGPHGGAYEKQKRKIGDYATAAAAVVLSCSDGICTHAAIALTNLSDTPLFAEQASSLLVGTPLGPTDIEAAAGAAEAICQPASDSRGPAQFRTKVAGMMVRRAINRALAGA